MNEILATLIDYGSKPKCNVWLYLHGGDMADVDKRAASGVENDNVKCHDSDHGQHI